MLFRAAETKITITSTKDRQKMRRSVRQMSCCYCCLLYSAGIRGSRLRTDCKSHQTHTHKGMPDLRAACSSLKSSRKNALVRSSLLLLFSASSPSSSSSSPLSGLLIAPVHRLMTSSLGDDDDGGSSGTRWCTHAGMRYRPLPL